MSLKSSCQGCSVTEWEERRAMADRKDIGTDYGRVRTGKWAGNTEPALLHCKAAQAAVRMKSSKTGWAPVQLPEQQQSKAEFCGHEAGRNWKAARFLEKIHVHSRAWERVLKEMYNYKSISLILHESKVIILKRMQRLKKTALNISMDWYDIHLDKAQGTTLKCPISHVQVFQ